MTIAAQYAFASLSLSAKLHQLLDKAEHSHREEAATTFENEINQTLNKLADSSSPLAEEAKIARLSLLKRDFTALRQEYARYKATHEIKEKIAAQLYAVFEKIEKKIKEKELLL